MVICQKDLTNGAVVWKCERRHWVRCPARAKTCGDELISQLNEHTHGPDPTRKDVTKVTSAITHRATETQETAQQIISTAVPNVSESTASQLPPIRHIRRAVRSHKKNAGIPLPIPPSLETMTILQQ